MNASIKLTITILRQLTDGTRSNSNFRQSKCYCGLKKDVHFVANWVFDLLFRSSYTRYTHTYVSGSVDWTRKVQTICLLNVKVSVATSLPIYLSIMASDAMVVRLHTIIVYNKQHSFTQPIKEPKAKILTSAHRQTTNDAHVISNG